MSYELVDAILKSGPPRSGDKLVLLAVASFTNVKTGRCDPSVAAIAERASMTVRGTRAIIRRLEVDGWLVSEIGGGRADCSAYRINTECRSVFSGGNPERGSPFSDGKPGTPRTETRNAMHENPERGSVNPERRSAEPRRTKKKNQEGEPTTRKRATERVPQPEADRLSSNGAGANSMFEAIYDRWPKRGKEDDARRAFKQALAAGADPEHIAIGAAAYVADRHRDRRGPAAVIQFTTPLARWLRERGWETWIALPDAERVAAQGASDERETMLERLRTQETRRRAMPF